MGKTTTRAPVNFLGRSPGWGGKKFTRKKFTVFSVPESIHNAKLCHIQDAAFCAAGSMLTEGRVADENLSIVNADLQNKALLIVDSDDEPMKTPRRRIRQATPSPNSPPIDLDQDQG